MPDNSSNPRRVVILTAIPIEYQAVRAHLTDLDKETHKGTIYQRGTFLAKSQSWDVIIVETGVGNVHAALEAERAISYFNPSLILFVGVAGGLKDVKLGDVVAASKVYAYESGRANVNFQTRPEVGSPTYTLEQLARAEAREKDWLQRLKESIPDPAPRVLVAPIAAGESVVASTRSTLYQFLRTSYSDAVAAEMEGHGFFQAVHANPRVDALSIRGISDLIKHKKRADAGNWQEIAASHASAFAFEILAKLEPSELRQNINHTEAASIQKQRQENEPNVHKTEMDSEFERTSISANSDQLFQEFLASAPRHHAEIKRVSDLFGHGQDIYPDQCDRVIKSLDSLDEPVQRLCRDTTTLSYADGAALVNLHSQISELRSDLHTFRHLCQPPGMIIYRRQYNSNHRQIRTKLDLLLGNLEQFINRM